MKQKQYEPKKVAILAFAVLCGISSVDRTGFAVVRVMTPAEAEFGWLEIGEPLGAVEPDSIVNEESGFVVFLPRRLSPEGDQQLRIGLETVLYDEAGEFGGEVFNRGEGRGSQTGKTLKDEWKQCSSTKMSSLVFK